MGGIRTVVVTSLAIAVTAVVALGGGTASAGSGSSVRVDPSPAVAGASYAVTVTRQSYCGAVTLTLNGVVFDKIFNTAADSNLLVATRTYTAPQDPGQYTIIADDGECTKVQTTLVVIAPAPTTVAPTTVAPTTVAPTTVAPTTTLDPASAPAVPTTAPPKSAALPATGAADWNIAVLGLAALLFGGGLVAVARRRS
jgi:LPXTG-motif cell wall-anchored protein